jgi:hypothetical protein
LFVDASGNVGLATSNPKAGVSYNAAARFLGVAGDGSDSLFSFGSVALQNNRATPASGDVLGSIDGISANNTEPLKTQIYFGLSGAGGGTGGFGSYIGFATRADNGSVGERLRITSDGRLGLGTSNAASKLSVMGTANNENIVQISNTAGAADGGATNIIQYLCGSSAYWANIRHNAYAHIFGVSGSASTVEGMRLTADGRLGIGVTGPDCLLHTQSSSVDGIYARLKNTAGTSVRQAFESSGVASASIGIPSGSAALAFYLASESTERMRIDSSGRLLVGTSTTFDANCQIQMVGNFTQAAQFFRIGGADNTTVYIGSARGSVSTPAVLASTDTIGTLAFRSYSGAAYVNGATIQAQIDGITPSSDLPTRLVFSTTADGASSPTERLRISQDGVVTIKNGAVAEIDTLADGATITPDLSASCNFTVSISGNRTLANPSNITAGQTGSIFIVQGTGSNALSWGSYWDFPAGTAPTLSTASGAVDRVDYIVRTSTSIHTVFTANYS